MGFRSPLCLALASTLALVLSGPAAADDNSPPRQAGASPVRLIGARCVFCHGAALMLAFSRRMLDAGGESSLDLFLASHHAPDADARALIVEFLVHPATDPGQ